MRNREEIFSEINKFKPHTVDVFQVETLLGILEVLLDIRDRQEVEIEVLKSIRCGK